MTDIPHRLALFLSFSGTGGVERMMLNLIPELLQAGVAVDLLTVNRNPLPPDLTRLQHPGLRLMPLGVRHTVQALPGLIRYLGREKPAVLLAAKDRAIRTAIVARSWSGHRVRLAGKLETNLSAALAHRSPLARMVRTYPMHWLYPQLDVLIVNARGVAEDALQLTGLPLERIHVIHNPVITDAVYRQSHAVVAHPWFNDPAIPVILGAGRLTRQKDFATLIQSFARLLERRQARLVILGEGRERPLLEQLIREAGIGAHVWLAGHVDNPYAYMARASLFALSSRWEGLPNVLAEAMALGIPVVSTDCPSGPDEILAGGRLGQLVAVGDSEALATALFDALANPQPTDRLRQAVADYHARASAERHIAVLGLNTSGTD